MFKTIGLLFLSNMFMTYAWYGHLKDFRTKPLVLVIFISWGIAFFEYCLQVPANRIGSEYFSLAQLKIIQEVITLIVFALFSVLYMKQKIPLNFLWAGICLALAVFFIFRETSVG